MSVFKTKKSGAVYWYSFDIDRNRFSGSTRCTTRKTAEAFEAVEKDKAKKAIAAQAKVKHSMAIDDVAARYWNQIGQHHAGADTTSRDLARLVTYFGKAKLMTDISDVDVSALVAWRRGQHVKSTKKTKPGKIVKVTNLETGKCNNLLQTKMVAAATVNRSTTEVLKKLFTFTKNSEGVRYDHEPKWKSHFLKEPEERVRELHDHEAKAIDDNMRDDYAPFFDFVRASGWRQGAAVELKWSEVNFGTKTITKLGKGGRRITLQITPSIHAILWPLQGHHPESVFTYVAMKTKKSQSSETGKIIGTYNKSDIIRGQRYPMTKSGLKTRWRRTRDDAGIKDFRFHDFRHDVGTKLLRQTGNLKLVQKALGHANLKTTSKYAHVLEDEVASAIEAMNTRRANRPLTADSNPASARDLESVVDDTFDDAALVSERTNEITGKITGEIEAA